MSSIPANTYLTYNTVGIREDLAGVIDRTDVEETPFYSTVGRATATQRIHEWQTQRLAPVDPNNAFIEGFDFVGTAATPTVRVNNRITQSRKEPIVSGTNTRVVSAGRENEMTYQRLLKGIELRRDIETMLLDNTASVAGSSTQAARSAGFVSWITSAVSAATDGVSGGFLSSTGLVAARTNGTLRQFQKSHIDTVMATAFSNGARPKIMMLPPALQNRFSAFTGVNELRTPVARGEKGVIIGGVDMYVSNFGTLTVVPSPGFMRERDVLLYDPAKVRIAFLTNIISTPMGRTGDNVKELMLAEWCLHVDNERAHALITDVQASS